MAKILYGIPVRENIKIRLLERIKKLPKKPTLAIIQVGDRADSNIYINNKIKFGKEIGIKVIKAKFSENISNKNLEKKIKKIGEDKNIDGVIIQLPLPKNIDSEKILSIIPKQKDADGLVLLSLIRGDKPEGEFLITPATARAVLTLLDFYGIKIKNKKIAVIGRSKLAGGPIAEFLKKRGAKVEVCHRSTPNTAEICKKSDILVSAAGEAGLVNKDFVNENQIVIDVGINKIIFPVEMPSKQAGFILNEKKQKEKLVGDVLFAEVAPIVKAITPVPGGIGPITVACLFENLIDLCYNRTNY